MLTVKQNFLVVAASVVASLLLMAGLNRVWPWDKRSAHNDLIGWQLGILGTTYAVILGFMLYAVWTSLEEAELNVDLEANGSDLDRAQALRDSSLLAAEDGGEGFCFLSNDAADVGGDFRIVGCASDSQRHPGRTASAI
jgi:hypothetical protein